MKTTVLSFIFALLLCAGIQSVDASNQEYVNVESVYDCYPGGRYPDGRTFEIDVYNKDTLVTGVNLDTWVGAYIQDYAQFEPSFISTNNAIIVHYTVKPDPNDPDTRYFWGSKRETPEYRRGFRVQIGVFKSHKEAVRRTVMDHDYVSTGFQYNMLGNTYYFDKPDLCVIQFEDYTYVVDNVRISFRSWLGGWNNDSILQGMIRDIQEGTNGVIRGKQVIFPEVDLSNIPKEMTLSDGKPVFNIPVKDSSKTKLLRSILLYIPDSVEGLIDPEARWDNASGDVQLKMEAEENNKLIEPFDVYLYGAIANKKCVFSDLFTVRSSLRLN